MEIILDSREKNLYENCLKVIDENQEKMKNIKIHSQSLDLGDAIIRYNNEEKIIIERKTISDLVSSIHDGRYDEQSFRLNNLPLNNHNIVYLIEGDIRKNQKDKQKIYSSMITLSHFKGFSVFRSFDIYETAYIICNSALKIKNEYIKGNNSYTNINIQSIKLTENENSVEVLDSIHECEDTHFDEEEDGEKKYCSVIKKSKKSSNITPQNISEIMLSQIPLVSYCTASAIMKKYGTLSNLIDEIKKNKNCLDNLKMPTRKINKSSVKNIVEFLV